ncbi:thiamine pyrophosphate-binding protein [Clostridium estertheticum]|uniref:Thiamine pyrophosphate-binding protein n=1 Tax=Clostridium estertheticum TaxID=238834 RepID=A0AA47I494_9CLOT|nr:thiamine pyrophosphate-binding protein [Clostridium estertheticum]MBU3158042.1 thiamine pyrophosphate-binding protein [Clostridium estertheticum]MBU3199942.1 thiamine pyrophosphate-binding protein [Clostridium estertheticum]WAG58987.1 thiamine pyrophosphate-binding protein [Clostridium estertheticum]WAG66960.1 thiamine pyrophosphate-binding protein [Clostridium estertheticum]
MRIADAIIKVLENNGVKCVFGIPASTFAGILDAMNDNNIEFIVTKNEAGCSYSASSYAELSNELGVCMLAGGVGLNNAINGIANAKRNKTPMLIITGNVRREYMGKGAFQEFDNASMVKSITKHSIEVTKEEVVIVELQKAMNIALTPPCGPVHISIPYDVQTATFEGDINLNRIINKPVNDVKSLEECIKEINKTEKGLIFIGRGTRGLSNEIKKLSRNVSWPIISTSNAKGIINTDFPYYIGNYGFCSTDSAIEYIEKEQIDCILFLGTSLGQCATRDYNDVLVNGRKVIRIDWDKKEFNKIFKEDISVCYELKEAMDVLINRVDQKQKSSFIKPEMNKPYVKDHTGISLRLLFEKFPEILPKDTCLHVDTGDYFNYVYKYLPIREDMYLHTSLNYGCIGTALAGVMGSYMYNKNIPYAVIAGDGAFYMNGTEILTAKEYNMPIIYFIINNSMFGLIKNGMKALFGRDFKGKIVFEKNSIASIAEAMGVEAVQITDLCQADSLKELMNNRTAPLVIEVITNGTEVFIDTDRIKKAI